MEFCKGSSENNDVNSYLVLIQSKSMTISYDMNKRLIGWLNLVRLACRVLKLLSWVWLDALRGWSRPAIAENTSRYSPKFMYNPIVLVCFVCFQRLVSNPKVELLRCPFREKKTRPPSSRIVPLEETSIGNWLNLAQICVNRTTISSNSEANLDLCPFSKTDDGFVRSRSLYYM